jgi:hypothetical protein
MATLLEKTLKRELLIRGQPFMLAISPTGLLLTVKGRRKGLELEWADLVSGEAALATALHASVRSPLGADPGSASSRRKPSRKPKGNGRVPARRS